MNHSTKERFVRPFWRRKVQEAVLSDEEYRNKAVGTGRHTSGLRRASKLHIFIDITLLLQRQRAGVCSFLTTSPTKR